MMNTYIVFHDHTPILTYAACEWFLIFLMFVDALLSYLLVWFARYCKLQMPCFLCSKLLHPLHWRLLLCRNHKSEVSSYMCCRNHNDNLADCRAMCDDCLLSFTKGPNPDMERLLLGKLGYDLLSKTHFAHPRPCSCCDKPWRTRQQTQRLIRLGGKPNIPAPRQQLTRRGSGGSLKKMRDFKTESGDEYAGGGSRAHVGYTELKIYSDSESEFLFSDDDAFLQVSDFEPSAKRCHKSRGRRSFDGGKKMPKRKQSEDKIVVDKTRKQQQEPVKAEEEEEDEHEAVLSELITMSQAWPFASFIAQKDSAKTSTHNENKAEESGNEEFSNSYGEKAAAPSEIQRDESADLAQNSYESAVEMEETEAEAEADTEQKVSDHAHLPGSDADESYKDAENGTEGDLKSSISDDKPVSQAREESSEKENNVVEEYFSDEDDKVNKHSEPSPSENASVSVAEEESRVDEDESKDYSVAKSRFDNEDDEVNRHTEPSASENASGSVADEEQSRGDEDSYSVAKSHSRNNDDVDDEDSKDVTSNNVTVSAIEHEHNDESSLEKSKEESSKEAENQNTSQRLKPSASVESFVSISNDVVEGEQTVVDLLKQQLENERKSLKDLSKELEEERNASAVATDEAMAMINRLQEEKAALRMEALQYLRMMDEQAEHDVEALERANDALADREKEIQDLEMELEYYRVKYPDEPREEILASMGILENVETTDDTSDTIPKDTM